MFLLVNRSFMKYFWMIWFFFFFSKSTQRSRFSWPLVLSPKHPSRSGRVTDDISSGHFVCFCLKSLPKLYKLALFLPITLCWESPWMDFVSFLFVFSVFPKASSPPQYFWEVHSNTINMGLSKALSKNSELHCLLKHVSIYSVLIFPNTFQCIRNGPPYSPAPWAHPLTGYLPAPGWWTRKTGLTPDKHKPGYWGKEKPEPVKTLEGV